MTKDNSLIYFQEENLIYSKIEQILIFIYELNDNCYSNTLHTIQPIILDKKQTEYFHYYIKRHFHHPTIIPTTSHQWTLTSKQLFT